jgi:hypothetical protein
MRHIVSVAVALAALAFATIRREWLVGIFTGVHESEIGLWIIEALRRLFAQSQIAQVTLAP